MQLALIYWRSFPGCCGLLWRFYPAVSYQKWFTKPTMKSMLRCIIFPFQQIQIHPNSSQIVFILLVDVTSLFIRSCPGSVRLTILVISFMNQVHKKGYRCLHRIIYWIIGNFPILLTTAKVICCANLLLMFLLWKQYLEPFQRVCLSNLPILEHYS